MAKHIDTVKQTKHRDTVKQTKHIDTVKQTKHIDTVKQTTIPSIADILTWRNICIHITNISSKNYN